MCILSTSFIFVIIICVSIHYLIDHDEKRVKSESETETFNEAGPSKRKMCYMIYLQTYENKNLPTDRLEITE